MKRVTLPVLALTLAVMTIACDRVTKHAASATLVNAPPRSWLGRTVTFEYSENTGAFLSLGANLSQPIRTGLFTVGTGLALVAMAAVAIPLRRKTMALAGVTLFVAGGASNWIDRAWTGHVVDFMILRAGPLHTGVFNVADAAIMAGAALLVIDETRNIWRRRHQQNDRVQR